MAETKIRSITVLAIRNQQVIIIIYIKHIIYCQNNNSPLSGLCTGVPATESLATFK